MQVREGVGPYIKAWRHRLQPVDAGLALGTSRRTQGLRREELASLADISVDYLVRLEQGRATNPSVQVLAALARALRLTIEERDHLYTVAGQAPLPSSRALSEAGGLGGLVVSVWLFAPCHVDGLGGVAAGTAGCAVASDGDMRLIAGS